MTAAVVRDEGDDDVLDAFTRPGPELEPIVARVLRMPEHKHLVEGDARIHWLMRREGKVSQGRRNLGMCFIPRVNGQLSSMFDWLLARYLGETPDFLIVLDTDWWTEEASERDREVLVFHELSHAVQATDANGAPKFNQVTGDPVWALQGHDIEEFNSVVARYGVWSESLREFMDAAAEGEAAKSLRRIR